MTPLDPPVVSLSNLRKTYTTSGVRVQAVDGLSLDIRRGERVVITGVSGCGKTTLLNILGLLDRPSEGDYLLEGNHTASLSEGRRAHLRAHTIRFVFQDSNVIPRRTALQNVEIGLRYIPIARKQRTSEALRALERVDLEERVYARADTLSGGERQRVAIARALLGKPLLLLCDEPTGNLDSSTSRLIMQLLLAISDDNTATVVVSHDPQLIEFGTKHLHMEDGRLTKDRPVNSPSRH